MAARYKVYGVHVCAELRAETESTVCSASERGWLKWSTLNAVAFAAAVSKIDDTQNEKRAPARQREKTEEEERKGEQSC